MRVLDPGIAISVEPTPVSGTPGDTITYTYVVSNTGDAALSDISVDDDRLGHIGDIPQLQPGHDATLHATRTLSATQVWVINTATARGTDASGASVSASDEASVTIVAAANGGQAATEARHSPASTPRRRRPLRSRWGSWVPRCSWPRDAERDTATEAPSDRVLTPLPRKAS